jgi:uncharacterized protein (DUF433 family)
VSAATAKIVYPHITKSPDICSGRACIAGTRVRVMDIVSLNDAGLSSDDIVRELPTLDDKVGVYAALVYYADRKDEIEVDFAEDRCLADESERQRLEHPGCERP